MDSAALVGMGVDLGADAVSVVVQAAARNTNTHAITVATGRRPGTARHCPSRRLSARQVGRRRATTLVVVTEETGDSDLPEQMRVRREKIDRLRERGVD